MFNSKIVSEYNINFNLTIWDKDKTVWLNRIIIPKKYRCLHIGTKLMNEFINWLNENHYKSYLLVSNCYGTNEQILIDFYKKFGYKITNEFKSKNNIYMIRENI